MDIPNNLRVILIAEDSPTQAENLRYFLEQQGYQVVTAKNGREALDLMARTNRVWSSVTSSCPKWTATNSATVSALTKARRIYRSSS